jgi:hypothetical protein
LKSALIVISHSIEGIFWQPSVGSYYHRFTFFLDTAEADTIVEAEIFLPLICEKISRNIQLAASTVSHRFFQISGIEVAPWIPPSVAFGDSVWNWRNGRDVPWSMLPKICSRKGN